MAFLIILLENNMPKMNDDVIVYLPESNKRLYGTINGIVNYSDGSSMIFIDSYGEWIPAEFILTN